MYNIHIHRYSYISLPFPRTQTRQNHSAYVHIFPILPSNQQSWQRHHPRQLANLALIPLAHCSKIHPKPNHTWVTAKRSWCKTPWWVEQLKLLKLGLFRPAAHRWKGRELLHTPQVGNLTMTGWPVKADKCGPEFRCKLSVLQLIHLIWEFPFNPISIWTGKKNSSVTTITSILEHALMSCLWVSNLPYFCFHLMSPPKHGFWDRCDSQISSNFSIWLGSVVNICCASLVSKFYIFYDSWLTLRSISSLKLTYILWK